MKMVTAIINKKDINNVCKELTNNGIMYTKIATIGGFLKANNTTLLIGIEEEKLDLVLKIIRDNSARRTEYLPSLPLTDSPSMMLNAHPVEIEVGGATVFVQDISYFEKM